MEQKKEENLNGIRIIFALKRASLVGGLEPDTRSELEIWMEWVSVAVNNLFPNGLPRRIFARLESILDAIVKAHTDGLECFGLTVEQLLLLLDAFDEIRPNINQMIIVKQMRERLERGMNEQQS